ncbi:hypothetical protein BGZ94_000169 [Podila epigama]|nr:hypothetical protein BGZ94_000169 [Podila epigama]
MARQSPATGAFILLTSFFISSALAQNFQPRLAYGTSSVYIEGKALYISGGHDGSLNNMSQTFSIDLSSPWTTAAPKFTQLSSARSPTDYQVPNALDKDKKSWLVISGHQSYRYDIESNLWGNYGSLANLYPVDQWYLNAAVDPITGYLLIPNGYINSSPTPGHYVTSMMQYNIVTNETTSIPMTNGPEDLAAMSVTWSRYLKKMVVFGGLYDDKVHNTLYTYDSTTGWTLITTTNPNPSPRIYHCATQTSDGTKLIIFGGITSYVNYTTTPNIYVLDLATWTWAEGPPLPIHLARANAACAVTGDYFIAWGGDSGKIMESNVTLLFNYKTLKWTDSFVPPKDVKDVVDGTDGGGGGKSKVGLYAGVAAGVVVVLALVGFLLFRRSKRRQGYNKGKNNDADGSNNAAAGGVNVIPIAAIDANHIWQPPTLDPQPQPQPQPVPTIVDPYALQQQQQYSPQQQQYTPQQLQHQYPPQQQYEFEQHKLLSPEYDQHVPPNSWPSPSNNTAYSATTAYSPYQQPQQEQQQQYFVNDGPKQVYAGNEGYVLPPPVTASPAVGVNNGSDAYKVEHTDETPTNRVSVNNVRSPQSHGDSPLVISEEKTSAGVIVRNDYAD